MFLAIDTLNSFEATSKLIEDQITQFLRRTCEATLKQRLQALSTQDQNYYPDLVVFAPEFSVAMPTFMRKHSVASPEETVLALIRSELEPFTKKSATFGKLNKEQLQWLVAVLLFQQLSLLDQIQDPSKRVVKETAKAKTRFRKQLETLQLMFILAEKQSEFKDTVEKVFSVKTKSVSDVLEQLEMTPRRSRKAQAPVKFRRSVACQTETQKQFCSSRSKLLMSDRSASYSQQISIVQRSIFQEQRNCTERLTSTPEQLSQQFSQDSRSRMRMPQFKTTKKPKFQKSINLVPFCKAGDNDQVVSVFKRRITEQAQSQGTLESTAEVLKDSTVEVLKDLGSHCEDILGLK